MKKKLMVLLLTLVMALGFTGVVQAAGAESDGLPYEDVSEGDWYYNYVKDVYNLKLMTGLNETTFGPSENLARAQFAVILYRMAGEPQVEYNDAFKDVPDGQWYSKAISWASENGIITGYTDSGLFGISDNINREQMATILYRYSESKEYGMKGDDISGYPDAGSVNTFAQEAMEWAVGENLIKGNDGKLDPQGSAVRAQCATIIDRFVDYTIVAAPGEYDSATEAEVKEALTDDSAIVIDARSNDAYIGWASGKNTLGGHIEGATDFSANWFTCTFDDVNNIDGISRKEHLQKYLDDKGITEDKSVIIYSEDSSDAVIVGNYLASRVENVKVFDLKNWTGDLTSYANYELWIPPTAVKDLVDGKEVAEVGEVKDLKIVEVSWGTEEESGFVDGHVPGAIHVNSDDFDMEENYYLLRNDEDLFNLAKSQGITTESTVITVGSPIFACRYAVILQYLGVENVYVMSGGYDGWTDAGYELETGSNIPTPVADFGATEPQNPDLIDTVLETKDLLETDDFILVDNRRIEEHKGETSGYGYFPYKGRIPGAVFGYAGINNSSSMLYYDNLDTTMRNADEILEMWKEAGIDTSKHLSFMCGGGYRAAEVLWDAKVMGLDNTSLFADGWCGWSSYEDADGNKLPIIDDSEK